MKKRDDRKPKRENHKHDAHERHELRDRDRDRDHLRNRGLGHGLEQEGYFEVLSRRWQGSDPPTPQAYARALRSWRQLPGAIVTAPADLGTIPEAPPTPESK